MRSRAIFLWLPVAAAVIVPRLWVSQAGWQKELGLWRDNVYVRVAEQYLAEGPFTGGWLMQPVERRLSEPGYYTNHPPLYPLAIAASMTVFGENYWAARMPELAASMALVILLWLIARRADDDLPGVSLFAVFLLALLPGMVLASRAGDLVAAPVVAGQAAIIWAYLRYRSAIVPLGGMTFGALSLLGLLTGWLCFAATLVCVIHLVLDRDRPPGAGRLAAGVLSLNAAGILLLLAFYVSAGGGPLFGLVRFAGQFLFHSVSGFWDGGALWDRVVAVAGDWRRMMMLPVLVIGLWELLFQPEDPRPAGIRTACRLLAAVAGIQTGLYFFGSLPLHDYLNLPLVAALGFASAVRLARLRQPVLAGGLAVLFCGAAIWGISGQLAADREFYQPRLDYYRQAAGELREFSRRFPADRTVAVGTNLWVPRGFDRQIAPNLRWFRIDRPEVLGLFRLDGFLAGSPPQGIDLTPVTYRRVLPVDVYPAEVWPSDGTPSFRWMEAKHLTGVPVVKPPEGEDAVSEGTEEAESAGDPSGYPADEFVDADRVAEPPVREFTDQPPPEGVSVFLDDEGKMGFVFRPEPSLLDTEIAILEKVYSGDELLREGGDHLELYREPGALALAYRPRSPAEREISALLGRESWILGAYAPAPIRVRFVTAEGRENFLDCPLPQPGERRCRSSVRRGSGR